MQASRTEQENLTASVATQSQSVPGLALKKFLAALKINNVATFSSNAARELHERRQNNV